MIGEDHVQGYLVGIVDIKDHAGYVKEYAPLAEKAIEDAGGKFLVRDDETDDNQLRNFRLVIAVFDSFEVTESFVRSGEFRQTRFLGSKYGSLTYYVAEGLPSSGRVGKSEALR